MLYIVLAAVFVLVLAFQFFRAKPATIENLTDPPKPSSFTAADNPAKIKEILNYQKNQIASLQQEIRQAQIPPTAAATQS
jgi:hypothetical protein